MTPVLGIIAAIEIIAACLLAYQALKGTPLTPSDAFTAALNALVASFTNKLAEKQTELDAANAQVAALQTAAADTDAADTAAVVAATPA